MIFLAGITIAIFLEFLLLSKKDKTNPDKVLTIWMFLIAVHMFLYYMELRGIAYEYPFLLGIALPLPLLQGVFLYFYVGSMTGLLPPEKWISGFHFLPTMISYLYLIPFFRRAAEEKIWVYQNDGAGYETFITVLNYSAMLLGIIYVLWSLVLLRRYKRKILERFSDIGQINLRWLMLLTTGMGLIWLIVIFEEGNDLTFMGVSVFVFLIAFFGIRQTRIFEAKYRPDNTVKIQEKYAKSGLRDGTSLKIYNRLIHLMRSEQLYKNGELSVGDLAEKLEVHPNHLSQVINQQEGRNFYDFVNNYRVEEFKNLISDPKNQHLTLLSLAYECGFNSKSAFNRYFKKATGQTPSEYFVSISSN